MTTTVALKQPLTTHAGTVTALAIREPVARDFIKIGKLPFRVKGAGDNAETEMDFALAAKWLSELSGIDEIILGGLARGDFLAAIRAVNDVLVTDGADPGN